MINMLKDLLLKVRTRSLKLAQGVAIWRRIQIFELFGCVYNCLEVRSELILLLM